MWSPDSKGVRRAGLDATSFSVIIDMKTSVVLLATLAVLGSCTQTNIVLVITDDQDLTLGGLMPMEKTQRLIGEAGVTFTNAFVTTPVCCPSRASMLSARYQHNHLTLNNSLDGGCSNAHWQQNVEPQSWPALLHDAGYLTFYAGKYLNQYGEKDAGGTEHVPRGWDWWIGLVGNSRYYNYTLSVNGSSQFHEADYLTDLIKEYGLEFLKQRTLLDNKFLMVLAPPASHAPFTAAPIYQDHYKNVTALKTPNFNVPANTDKHWLLQMSPVPLPDSLLPLLDEVYRHRWETLLSVDDMVEAVILQLNSSGLLENTHVIMTSDHGYHIGQFALPWDKRQPYEMDIRVPLLVRGPGIVAGRSVSQPVLNIDLGPTFLDMADLEAPSWMDGTSFLPLLQDTGNLEDNENRTFLIEYHGEGTNTTISSDCPFYGDNTVTECSSDVMCKCQDSKNNTYSCVRVLNPEENVLFCKFEDSLNFMEVYDVNADPYQLTNMASNLSSADITKFTTWLNRLKQCSGSSCQFKLTSSRTSGWQSEMQMRRERCLTGETPNVCLKLP
ncbi:hypothetical protein L9F63_019287, partial [Diploptera punctata]